MTSVVTAPDVSFVIAAYNAEETLESAIDSALAQVDVSLEVIVVDDCSSDGTRELALRCRDRDDRVKLIVQPVNGGPAAARNAGFDAATGRWIAVLDADDTIHPQRLKRMIARAEAMDARIVVDNIDVVPLEGGQPTAMFSRSDLEARNTLELADFIESNIIFESTFNFGYMKPIFRRDFLNEHGLRFDENLRIGEDYILLASAIASGGVCAIEPEAGYVYHLRHGSISRVLKPEHLTAMLAGDEKFLGRFTLERQAMAAQLRRTQSIREAASFLTLVDEIKKRSFGGILKTAIDNPRALKHLRMPIAVRMRRFARAAGVS
ncbi:glycosyltransferase family 2 protein [Rhizobium sp. CFBP 13726]|uniref:glycosyltransferase family 2 protein n=1 Tax=Rhizobium sp. CFBP 13726 TaxID=2775296 RepID=UPI00177AC9F3|nr:glycosyltransferase family 2 protein [Rhizobium sp. CFBP 13726]MBD8651875.1 glycosyltransferase family 2 protein [Rhizobium sp. CFBP 13726]